MEVVPSAMRMVPFLKVMSEFFNNWKPLVSVPGEPAPGSFKVYVCPPKSTVNCLSEETVMPGASGTSFRI